MNLYDVETFLVIAASRSISEAAKRLHITQSSVSHRLQSLEKELDMTLVSRRKGSRQIELTAAGDRLIYLAEEWVAVWKRIQSLKHEDHSPALAVAGTDRLNVYSLTGLYKQLSEKSVNLTTRTQQTPEVYDLVENREVDVGFGCFQMRYKNIDGVPIFREKIVVVCNAANNFPPGAIHPDQLDARDEIFLHQPPDILNWHDHWWSPAINPYARVDTASMIKNLMFNPRFWVLCPISIAMHLVQTASVTMHELSVPVPDQVSYMLVHKTPRTKSLEGLRILKGALAAFLKTIPWRYTG